MLRLRFPMLFAGVLLGLYTVLTVFSTLAKFSMLGLVTPSLASVVAALVLGLFDTVTIGLAALMLCVSAGYGMGARATPALVLQSARYLRYFWWAFLARFISGLLHSGLAALSVYLPGFSVLF